MKKQDAVALGKIGRSKNTEAQANASKENGKKGGRPKNGLPKTEQRNLVPGDKSVVFLSDATDDSGVAWPKGSIKTPLSGGFSNEKNCRYQDFTDKTVFYEK